MKFWNLSWYLCHRQPKYCFPAFQRNEFSLYSGHPKAIAKLVPMNCTALMHLQIKMLLVFPGLGRCIGSCIFLQLWPNEATWQCRLASTEVQRTGWVEKSLFPTSALISVRPHRKEMAVLVWELVFNQLNLFLPWHAQFHYKFSETVASFHAMGLKDGKVFPLFNWEEKLVTAAAPGVCLGSSTATPSGGHTAAHFSSNMCKAWAKPCPEHVLYAVCSISISVIFLQQAAGSQPFLTRIFHGLACCSGWLLVQREEHFMWSTKTCSNL